MKWPTFMVRMFAGLSGCSYETPPREEKAVTPTPPNLGWMHPDSEVDKLAFLGVTVGEVVDTYLYFVIGDIGPLDELDLRDIAATFFVAPFEELHYGDIEPDVATDVPGQPKLLRLRGKLRMYPSMTLRGRYCPLYKVGKFYLFADSTMAPVNFHTHWNRQNLDTGMVLPPMC